MALPTPYSDLNAVLREMVERIQVALRGNFVGAYLQGSFATGDFDVHSDCDFIVVTVSELSEAEVQALQDVHGRIYDLDIAWAQHLEGSYFPKNILRDCGQRSAMLWFLDHGSRSLEKSTHCNTSIVRWVVREQGVILAGPQPKTLIDSIPVETMRAEMLSVLHGWGSEILADPTPYNNRFYQAFIVLSYCRILHDLQNGFPGSKRAGAEWAKATLDPRWAGLIDRTWACRPNPAESVRTPADPQDFQATLEFVAYVRDIARARYPTAYRP